MGELDCELGCALSIMMLHTSRMLKIGHLAQIGGLITHCIFFWSKDVVDSFKQARTRTQPDPHWQVINKNYKEVPWWWYLILLGLSFFAGTCILLIPRPPEADLDGQCRLDRRAEGPDYSPLVVVHHRTHRRM